MAFYLWKKSYVIRIRLQQERDQVDQTTDPKQPRSQEVQDPHADLALIEFMTAHNTKEQAKQNGYPFIFFSASTNNYRIGDRVCVRVCICIVDDNVRLIVRRIDLLGACLLVAGLRRLLRIRLIYWLLCCRLRGNIYLVHRLLGRSLSHACLICRLHRRRSGWDLRCRASAIGAKGN